MKLLQNILFAILPVFLTMGCTDNSDSGHSTNENKLNAIHQSVDKYFTIEEGEQFIRTVYVGDYSEPFVGHVYEYVVTRYVEGTEGSEFNYLARVSYGPTTSSVNIVTRNYHMLTGIEDLSEWIEKRKQLHEAKKVK